MTTTDLVRPEDQAVHGFELAERVFTAERRVQVAQFLNITAEDPVLIPYLVACATYGLSPIMGEIWLIPQKVKVRNGDTTTSENRYRPAVGRDGFLTIARRDKRYAGLQGAVICEHDTFEVEYTGNLAEDPKVLHRFASKPTVFEPGDDPGRWRGRILGAWAKCYTHGQPPTFYEASLREHGKLEQEWEWGQQRGERKYVWLKEDGAKTFDNTGRPSMQWAGAWEYVSAMILKAAQSYVLRIAMGITGLAPADEMQPQLTAGSGVLTESVPDQFEWEQLECPPELRERLRLAVEAANELAPMSWSPAKCEMVLMSRSVEELEDRAASIEREAELHAAAIDPPRTPIEAAPQTEHEPVGQVEDAVVVEPPPPLTDEQKAQLEALRHREGDLVAGVDAAEVGSEEHATLLQELEQVETEVRNFPPAADGE